ncbi:MAG TPA: RIP metalloprotease RseP [Acidobacteriaceae bacterium]|nr:RIP metalloprotease RseP [Acidobacteriaceae bacterium]
MSFAVVSIVSFFIVLSIMVLVHELGHFVVAKACGVRVEAFSLGFPPRLFGIKVGETDYCIGALPFGGYVKMSGENPGAETTGDAGEFGAHPRWQRMLIAVAGPIANFILAFVLMAGFFMLHNEVPVYQDATVVLDIVPPNSPAGRAGLLPGDRIVKFDSDKDPTWLQLSERAALNANSTVPLTVERTVHGQTTEFSTEIFVADPSRGNDFDIMSLGLIPVQQPGPVMVEDVVSGDPAARAGIQTGDGIVAVNGQAVHGVQSIIAILDETGSKPVTLLVVRGGKTISTSVQPIWADFSGETPGYRLGFGAAPPPFRVEQSPLPKAVRQSVAFNMRNSGYILDILGRLFSHHGAVLQQLSGPIGIARATGEAAESHGLEPIIYLTALISLNLGIMNLLPIPILDGGMILLLAIEGALRRDLKQEFKERVYQVAFVMLILFFAFVMVNDVSKLNLFSKLKP